MTILYFATEPEACAAVTADGGDVRTNVQWRYQSPQWAAYLGADRRPPPEIYKTARQLTSLLTAQEKAQIFGAALGNAESTSGVSVVFLPVSFDPEFNAVDAAPVIEQLVSEGLLLPARAAEILS